MSAYPYLLLIASFLRIEFYGLAIAGFPATAVERMFATYYIADYESSRRKWILLISIPTLVVLPQPFVFSCLFTDIPMVIPLCSAGSMLVASQIVFNILYELNVKESLMIKKNPIRYTLGRKFQLEENLKVMWYLRGVGVLLLLLGLTLILILIFPYFLPIDNYAKSYCAIDLLLALASLILPIFMSTVLYLKQQPAFLRKTSWLFGKPTNTAPAIRRFTRIHTQDETSTYFRQFDMSWK